MTLLTPLPDELLAAVDRYLLEAQAARKARALTKIERRLAIAFREAFHRQGAALLKRLDTQRGRWQLEEAARRWRVPITAEEFDFMYAATEAGMRQAFLEPYRVVGRTALLRGAGEAMLNLGVRLDLANPRAVAYLERQGADLVTRIAEETRTRLRTVLVQAVDEGRSYNELAGAIRTTFDDFGGPRAKLIAVTETGEAYAEGGRQAATALRDLGVGVEKRWLTASDDRVDDEICGPNEDAGWIPLDEPYPSGHIRPLGHPGCRCDEEHRAAPDA